MTAPKLTAAILFLILWAGMAKAQQDIIEIDSLTSTANKVMPFNKAFTVKVPIDADDVGLIHIIKKYKYNDLDNSIGYYIKKGGGSFRPTELPSNYYTTKKIGDKNYLFISFADTYVLEPSSSYFIIIGLSKADPSVLSFFDKYYQFTVNPAATPLIAVTNQLQDYEDKMHKVFGQLVFNYYTVADFTARQGDFARDFSSLLAADYATHAAAVTNYNLTLAGYAVAMLRAIPALDSLSFHQLILDSTVNADALKYIMGKELQLNDISSDLQILNTQTRLVNLLNGSISLSCVFCDPLNINSTQLKDINKRISNIESSITQLNSIRRALYLLNPKSTSTSNIQNAMTRLINWINFLQQSHSDLQQQLKMRKVIENKIITGQFINSHASFFYSSLISGNSYLNFETRNKILLTPDFGVVTPAITSQGKKLEYGLVPYLGFHVNFMAVDKDLPFNSYKKNWKQFFSLMVGWSLVNMRQDSVYDNFFEKSSLLTGLGYRLNNVIRITGGTQWLFKFPRENNQNELQKRSLKAIPYLGISFDLNIKQYLNGFTDLLSEIGKSKIKIEPTISQNN